MPVYKNLAGLLRGPVGNNLDNDPQDVENLKRNFSLEGRYQRPVENGYIDRELDESIWSFQKDYGLKQDGRANPGGETEATLIGVLRGYETPKDLRIRKSITNVNEAHPAIGNRIEKMMLGGGGAMSAAEAWRQWQSTTTEDRSIILKKLEEDDNEIDKKCDEVDSKNRSICEGLKETAGNKAAAICHESASRIYSECRRGRPDNSWPPLQEKY